PAPPATSPAATNCDEPAKTKADMAAVAATLSPLFTASAPKMMPKGMAPTTSGKVALTPCQNSAPRVCVRVESIVEIMLNSIAGPLCHRFDGRDQRALQRERIVRFYLQERPHLGRRV